MKNQVRRSRRVFEIVLIVVSSIALAVSSPCSGYPEARTRQALDLVGNINLAGLELSQNEVTSKIFDVEGVVVANYERTALNGFFLQAPVGSSHQIIPGFSQSVFVSLNESSHDVAEGDYLRVKGRLTLRQTLPILLPTFLQTACGNSFNPNGNPFCPSLCANVAITEVAFPLSLSDAAEIRGMLISIRNELTVVDTFEVVDGKLGLSTGGRLFHPASVFSVESSEFDDLDAENSISLINLIDPFIGACGVGNSWVESLNLGIGSVLESRTLESNMVLIPSFGEDGDLDSSSLQLTATFQGSKQLSTNFDSPEVDLNVGLPSNNLLETMKVATFNIENFFLTLQEDDSCDDCRGADTTAEFERQRVKVVNALLGTDAAVIGLQELENIDDDSVLEFLVGELNSASGSEQFSFIPTGNSGSDVIRNGILYRTDIVTPLGTQFFQIEHSKDSSENQKSRPTLFQRFKVNGCAIDFLFGVSHLKSKGSSCETDPEGSLEGESNCGGLRLDHVQEILSFLDSNNFSPDTENIFLVGDFNSYSGERSMQLLVDAGFSQLFSPESSYTTSFRGEVGALDHIFMSQSLKESCDSGLEWHINSDQMTLKDYDIDFGDECTSKPDAFFQPSPLRSSDHDPVIIVCNFKEECSSSTIHVGVVEVDSISNTIKLVVLETVQDEVEQLIILTSSTGDEIEVIWRFSNVLAGTVVSFNFRNGNASIGELLIDVLNTPTNDTVLIELKDSAAFALVETESFDELLATGRYKLEIDAIILDQPSSDVVRYTGQTEGSLQELLLNLFASEHFTQGSGFTQEFTLTTEIPTVSPTVTPSFSPTVFPTGQPEDSLPNFTRFPTVQPIPFSSGDDVDSESGSDLSLVQVLSIVLVVLGVVVLLLLARIFAAKMLKSDENDHKENNSRAKGNDTDVASA